MSTKEEIKNYLERLKQLGIINMYEATPYLMREFNIPEEEAMKELSYWIKNYYKEEK